MLLEVGDFCKRVNTGRDLFIRELQAQTGRYGAAEQAAWRSSLAGVAGLLGRPELASFHAHHLHLGQRGSIAVEYRLPASSSWCDVVLLGRGAERPAAVILELKDWDTTGDRPGPAAGLIERHGDLDLHPSEQVRGYVEYCQRFHSAVRATADVHGAVYFTRAAHTSAYLQHPHDGLTSTYPVFGGTGRNMDARFPAYLAERLEAPDVDFACRFEAGTYRQDRNFCQQIAETIQGATDGPFVLLDAQRKGFEVAWLELMAAIEKKQKRVVLIVEGPPGSGKSALAAQLWARLVRDESLPAGNVVLTTTSSSQRSNWERLFADASGETAGRGIVKPANQYAPESTAWVGGYRRKHGKGRMQPESWRENVATCRRSSGTLRCADGTFLVSIVDEAHALLNPEVKAAQVGPTGWPAAFGPQAFHIIRASRVSVFLLDTEQSFRDRETTRPADIATWARELGAETPATISLAGAQFRAGGSREYLEWAEGLLGWGARTPAADWRKTQSNPDRPFTFEIVADPLELEHRLRDLAKPGCSARLLAAYGRPWKTKKARAPHALPGSEQDFNIVFSRNGTNYEWSRVWNVAPGASPDYSRFIQAPPGSPMHSDPLSEVGCPYVVRGFDYDYVGILWLSDLVWRRDRWVVQRDHIHESGIRLTLAAAKREGVEGGPATTGLLRRAQQAYRILLSRAMKGVYVWFEDDETRIHVEETLK